MENLLFDLISKNDLYSDSEFDLLCLVSFFSSYPRLLQVK